MQPWRLSNPRFVRQSPHPSFRVLAGRPCWQELGQLPLPPYEVLLSPVQLTPQEEQTGAGAGGGEPLGAQTVALIGSTNVETSIPCCCLARRARDTFQQSIIIESTIGAPPHIGRITNLTWDIARKHPGTIDTTQSIRCKCRCGCRCRCRCRCGCRCGCISTR